MFKLHLLWDPLFLLLLGILVDFLFQLPIRIELNRVLPLRSANMLIYFLISLDDDLHVLFPKVRIERANFSEFKAVASLD